MTGRIAVKKNLKLWEEAKKKAETVGGFTKHSARKMQWATNYYKKHGGTYVGGKSNSNSLTVWGKEKWRTHSGKPSKGKLRYYPDKIWNKLSKKQVKEANLTKEKGFKRGKQYVKNPPDIGKIMKDRKKSPPKTNKKQKHNVLPCSKVPKTCNKSKCNKKYTKCKHFHIIKKYS